MGIEEPRYLITTADENTWSFDRPVLFLGRWCLLSSRKHIWSKLDYKVVPYHWSDSRKMQRNAKTVEVLYEKLLIELMELLNKHHNINWSLRAWRILIGPWLCRYIQVFYDRWLSIQYAIKNYNIIGGSYNEKNWEDMVPSNFDNFSDLVKTDNWNYHIYSYLLKYNHVKRYNKNPSLNNLNQLIKHIGPQKEFSIRNILLYLPRKVINSNWFHSFAHWFARDNKYYLFQTYIKSKIKVFQLSIKLGDRPLLSFSQKEPHPSLVDKISRNNLHTSNNHNEGFDQFIREMIPYSIPIIYIEGFNKLIQCTENSGFPSNNKAIITTIGIWKDEVFKAWVALRIQKGVKLLVGQHGGEYGTCLFSLFEKHEIEISDKYLTWGWEGKDEKTTSALSPILINSGVHSWEPDGPILLVLSEMGRYLSQMHPNNLVADRASVYLNNIINLISLLSEEKKELLIIKLFPSDGERGNPIGYPLRKEFPNINMVTNSQSFSSMLTKSRLSIHMDNGTTFLETIGNDQPCMLVYDPLFFPLRDSAKKYYNKLKQVGIYHENNESAIRMLNKVSQSIDSWWYKDDVIKVKNDFCTNFVRKSDNPIEKLRETIINCT